MPARTTTEPSDASLSALSDVDERFLEVDQLLPSFGKKNGSPGRAKQGKPSGINARDKTHGRTLLHKACSKGNLDRVHDLVEHKGALCDVVDNAGVTPLHEACSHGHVEVVRFLLAHGVSISPKDSQGDYPLLDAAQNDDLDICRILLEAGANPTVQNTQGMSALSEAEEGPTKELLRQYSTMFDCPGRNKMRIADVLSVDEEPKATIKSLQRTNGEPKETIKSPQRTSERVRTHSNGINIDSKGARKVDKHGRDKLHQYVIDEDDELVEQFLEIQDCDFRDYYGDTPLHSAARAGNGHLCGLLLEHRAKIAAKNKRGNTPLHEACYKGGNRVVILALLDAGASALSINNEGLTPGAIAATQLGEDAPETKLLQTTEQKERIKAENRRKRGSHERKSSTAESRGLTSPQNKSTSTAHSPISVPSDSTLCVSSQVLLSTESDMTAVSEDTPRARLRGRRPPILSDDLPQEIAVTVATSTPPDITTSMQQVASHSGRPRTQFLTEFKSTSALASIDSSVRGSPLPLHPSSEERLPNHGHLQPYTPVHKPYESEPLQVESQKADVTTLAHKRPASAGEQSTTAIGSDQAHKRLRTQSRHDPGLDAHDHAPVMSTAPDGQVAEMASLRAAIEAMGRKVVGAIERQNVLIETMLSAITSMANRDATNSK